MKKLIYLVFVTVFALYIVAPRPAHAAVNFFGFQIPTSAAEFKALFVEKIETTFPNLPIPFANTEESIPQDANEGEDIPTDTVEKQVQDLTQDEVISITQRDLNNTLSAVSGQSFQGYTLADIDVALKENGAMVSVALDNGKAVDLDLELTDGGKGLRLKGFTDTGSQPLSFTERLLLPTMITSAPKLVMQYAPSEAKSFKYAVITPEKIELHFVRNIQN